MVLGSHQRSCESLWDLLARVNGVVSPVQGTRQCRSIGNRRGDDQEPGDHDRAEQAQHHGHREEPARPPEATPAPRGPGGSSAGGTCPVQAAQVPAGRAAVGTARRGHARPRWSWCCHATSRPTVICPPVAGRIPQRAAGHSHHPWVPRSGRIPRELLVASTSARISPFARGLPGSCGSLQRGVHG